MPGSEATQSPQRRRAPARTAARAPRTLAEDLRSRTESDLADLLRARPDLAVPAPPDITTLAMRAAGRASVRRAVDLLDAAAIEVLEVLAILPEPTSLAEVSRRWGATAREPVDRLRALALVWGGPRSVYVLRAAQEAVGPFPAGLGPPLVQAFGRRSPRRLDELLDDLDLPAVADGDPAARAAAHLSDPTRLSALLERAPEGARRVLDRLAWGPPVGAVEDADRAVRAATAVSAVDWLLAHGLLAVSDPGHVVLPREIALALRDGRVHIAPAARPPDLDGARVTRRRVHEAAAAAAADAVRLVERLCDAWEAGPPAVLRSGGVGVRELRRTAATLGVDEPAAAVLVETAWAAGLLGVDGDADPVWAPTAQLDAWRLNGTGTRWARLAMAWLDSTRVPGLVGTRDERGAVRVVLEPGLDDTWAPALRRQVLGDLAVADAPGDASALDEEEVLAAGAQSLLARLTWAGPRRGGRLRAELLHATLHEAAVLGVTGAGVLSDHGAALLADATESLALGPAAGPASSPATGPASSPGSGEVSRAAAALDAALPAPVDHVLLQADLTAVAPGPLQPALAMQMSMVADVDSHGPATVFRFSEQSLQRAFDAGLSAADVLSVLETRSRTPVPQPLSYLVLDAARRHGRLRIGAAAGYVRSDDEATLAQLLADPRAAGLHLRRLAPTVLVTAAEPSRLLAALRSMGLAPVAESSSGVALVGPAHARRAAPRPPVRRHLPALPSEATLHAVVRAMRAADAGGSPLGPSGACAPDSSPLETGDPASALTILREAARRRQAVWVGYADSAGRRSRRLIEPLTVDAGRVTAYDSAAERVTVFALHRLSVVAD